MNDIEVTSSFDPLIDPWDPYAESWTTVAIVIATYGYEEPEWTDTPDGVFKVGSPSMEYLKWEGLANRAFESAAGQGAKVLRIHGETLASARNEAAKYADSNWLIFLDADDELAPNYVRNMLKHGEGDIRKPATLGVVDGKEDDYSVIIPERDINIANHIVIGAMVRRDWFLAVGGFRELPALEDWDLWLRLHHEFDATVSEVPEAVYRVHVQSDSRNQDKQAHSKAYVNIRDYARLKYGVPYG